METESIPQQVQDPTESADLVVSILAEFDADLVAKTHAALRALPGPLRIAVIDNEPRPGSAPVDTEGTEKRVLEEGGQKNAALFRVSSPLTRPEGNATGVFRLLGALQSVFAAAEKLNARGCCVIASNRETATPGYVWQLAQPLFDGEVDLVLPHYTRRKFNGLLTNSIIAPLIRALYGKRVNNPMGPDFAASERLIEALLSAKAGGNAAGSRRHPLASITSAALCGNLQIKEVYCGARIYPPTDWTAMSSVLADFLGPVFLDVELNAPCWQRTRSSSAIQAIGEPPAAGADTSMVDTGRMVESFQLGNRELQEIWGLVLPPSTLFELRKLARLPVEQFRMPDELWVRIVYDFCLAHRLRTISRDHLLKSMTPLYLGWVASYAQDLKASGATNPEARLERLALAYEAGRSYLVSRWRWPDRFNP